MEKYKFYYFNDCVSKDHSSDYSNVTEAMSKNLASRIKIENISHANRNLEIISEIIFGYFKSEGVFVTNLNDNSIKIKEIKLHSFQLKIIREDEYRAKQILFIEYKTPSKIGVIKFIGSMNHIHFFSEVEIINIFRKLQFFITKNYDFVIRRNFTELVLEQNMFYPKLEYYVRLANEIACLKIESSIYIPAKENKFYTHIKLLVPSYATKYFIKLLLDFCKNDLEKQSNYNSEYNNITYLDYYDSMWQPDHEEKISSYEWELERARFVISMCKSFDEHQCFIETMLG